MFCRARPQSQPSRGLGGGLNTVTLRLETRSGFSCDGLQIANAKVLVVGAGGIGCELLKTLVVSGFRHIVVIDLDTIDVSNLNRQFLFRRHHVGKSKALVAAESVAVFCPDANIEALQANIKEPRFDIDYYKGFDLVLNALDNLEARRHVNRLCVAAGRPHVESGTAGYQGQVTVHVPGASECYECTPRAPAKSFPICTIRNTPEKAIHCVVWAKELLFARLFGPQDAVTDLDETSGADGEQGKGSAFVRRSDESAWRYAQRVFQRVFSEDITRVCSMEELWKTRRKPQPLELAQLLPDGDAAMVPAAGGCGGGAAKAAGCGDFHKVWRDSDSARVFLNSIHLMLSMRGGDVGALVFDKDDELAMDFVTAAANLRASCFGIAKQSRFDAKGMAGNIIHAIATTNAVTAGLIVSQALHLLLSDSPPSDVFIAEVPSSGRRTKGVLLHPNALQPPKPGCLVCGRAQVSVRVNTTVLAFAAFVDKLLKSALAFVQPSVICGTFMYEEGDDLEEDELAQYRAHRALTLASLPGGGIRNGAQVQVQDQSQDMNITIHVVHQELDEEEAPDGFLLDGSVEPPSSAAEAGPSSSARQPSGAAGASTSAAASAAAGIDDDDDDDVAIVDDDDNDVVVVLQQPGEASTSKRPWSPHGGDAAADDSRAKRAKQSLEDGRDGDVVVLD